LLNFTLIIKIKKNSVFFAGEGTSHNFMGTVHGALLSGRKAAQNVIKQAKAGS
jgi:monoamine oxidase